MTDGPSTDGLEAVDLETVVADEPRHIRRHAFDDWANVVGAALAALASVWLLFERLLPVHGRLGATVAWYAAFLAFHTVLTRLSQPWPVVVDRLVGAVVTGAALLVVSTVVLATGFVFERGWAAVRHANFFVDDMAGVRPTAGLGDGGILHALAGSAIQVGLAVVISLPIGLGTAIFLNEVGGRLASVVRTFVEAMTALPTVLAGLFVYATLIIGLHWERDGFAVALALCTTMIPVVARSSEVALAVVPDELREASAALGATHWRSVRHVVLPTARPGLATALILGVARVTGETAPLIIVSGASTFLNTDPFHEPMNSLPLFVFSGVRSGLAPFEARAYGAAAVLAAVVLALFALTRWIAGRGQGRRWGRG